MAKAKPAVPGVVTPLQRRDESWWFRWDSPTGTSHYPSQTYETEAKALTAGRAFARKMAGSKR